jgi:hypothetical protein
MADLAVENAPTGGWRLLTRGCYPSQALQELDFLPWRELAGVRELPGVLGVIPRRLSSAVHHLRLACRGSGTAAMA